MNYNIRVLHPKPSDPLSVPINANGRTYYPANGVQDVPYSDAWVLQGNGWVLLPDQKTRVGTTAERPKPAQTSETNPITAYKNTMFIDTTINKLIIFDGIAWRDHTGTVV